MTTVQVWVEPVEALRLRVMHRFVGERYQGGDFANREPQVDGYHLVDLGADYQLNENCRIFLKADNVFDTRYAESVFLGVIIRALDVRSKLGLRCGSSVWGMKRCM